jgi:type II secretory pathway pseudopilin PulG
MVAYLILLTVIAIVLAVAMTAISAQKRREKRAAKCVEMNATLAINNMANDALAKLIR